MGKKLKIDNNLNDQSFADTIIDRFIIENDKKISEIRNRAGKYFDHLFTLAAIGSIPSNRENYETSKRLFVKIIERHVINDSYFVIDKKVFILLCTD